MKIKILVINIMFLSTFVMNIKIKTDANLKIKFSSANYIEDPQKATFMEDIIPSKPINVNSRIYEGDKLIKTKTIDQIIDTPINFIETNKNSTNFFQDKNQSMYIDLKNLESPVIIKKKKEDPNPIVRSFSSFDITKENGFSTLLDYSKLQSIQNELLNKLKEELHFGINKPDPQKLMLMHVEKVPVVKNQE